MSYRVCIPTAGTGSRLGGLTRFVNKSLVSIANRPTLAHLIELFPADAEFVIALGHKGELVREFLELAYPQRRFFFAVVSPFEGPGSGLGLSLIACREFLQQPFVFISCDTLVREAIPAPDHNWMAYADLAEIGAYRTIALKDGSVAAICEKGKGTPGTHRPYIGLAGIHDYRSFWSAMMNGGDVAVRTGEAHGLRDLLPRKVAARRFTWHDTGNLEALARTRLEYREPGAPNILEKANEAIWFVDGQVIKFSDDRKFIGNRVERVRELRGFVPEITGSRPHMYRYAVVEGEILSEVVTLPMFERLLEHSAGFWKRQPLGSDELLKFKDDCRRFYRDKTLERVELFFKNFSRLDGTESINGEAMPRLGSMLNSLDWDWLAEGIPGRFHGDFHFENILWSDASRQFTFLDWRQDFGGSLTTGDIYYDFAKLMHGLIISHELIVREHFWVKWADTSIRYDFHRKQILVECERRFESWLAGNGYDAPKVRVLTALIFLNIAPLHHHPYSLLLFSLGKDLLSRDID